MISCRIEYRVDDAQYHVQWMLFECCCRHLPYHIISAAAPWETGAPISCVKYAKWARGATGSLDEELLYHVCHDLQILKWCILCSYENPKVMGWHLFSTLYKIGRDPVIYVQSESRLPTAMGWFDQLNIFCKGFLHWIELKIISGSTIQKCFRIVSDWLSNRIGWKYSRYSRLEWLYLEYSAAPCHSCFLLFGCAHIWAQVQRWALL